MSTCECPSPVKCSATGHSSVLLCVMLKRLPLTLRCRGFPVLATYCWPHLLQVIKQIILEDLQEAANFILNFWPVLWLVNSSVAVNIGHVLQPVAPHGRLPGVSLLVAFRDTRTKRSLRFLGLRKAIKGGCRKVPRTHSQVCKVGKWRLVINWKSGKIGCYVTTSGIRADLSWFGCECKQFSLDIASAQWISWFNCCSQYPHFNTCRCF